MGSTASANARSISIIHSMQIGVKQQILLAKYELDNPYELSIK